VAGRLGASGELDGGCRAHAAATNVVLAIGGCLMFVGLAACSGLWRLALLCNCQCGVGQHRRAALAATTRWDDLTCSGLWRAVQLHCGYSGAVHRRNTRKQQHGLLAWRWRLLARVGQRDDVA
jgi:hypothetical protein